MKSKGAFSMSRSLESVIEEIAENEEMSREFIAMDEIDEIYEYCKNMGLGSSEEEFDEEVSSMVDNFYIYSIQIDKNDLSLVAGGSSLNKHFNKAVASALSALVLTGAGAANSNIAAGVSTPPKSVATSASADTKTANKKYVAKNGANAESDSKFSKTVESIKEFFRKHKLGTGITAAAILMLIYAGFAYHNGDARFLKWGRKVERGSQNTGGSGKPFVSKEEEHKERLRKKMVDHGYVLPELGKSTGKVVEEEDVRLQLYLNSLSDDDKRLAQEIMAEDLKKVNEAGIAQLFTALPEIFVEKQDSAPSSTSSSGGNRTFYDEGPSDHGKLATIFEEKPGEIVGLDRPPFPGSYRTRRVNVRFDEVDSDSQKVITELNDDLIREQNGENLASKVDEWQTKLSTLTDDGKKYVKGFLGQVLGCINTIHHEMTRRPLYRGLYEYTSMSEFYDG